jgi:hypothetical protein
MASKESTPKFTYNVFSTLKHDNKYFLKGSTVELTHKDAARPLKHKTIEPAK